MMNADQDTVVERWLPVLNRAERAWQRAEQRFDDAPPPVEFDPSAPRTTDEEFTDLESRLGSALPPDYRGLLRLTGGWYRMTSTAAPLLPAASVGRLRDVSPWLVATWREVLMEAPTARRPDPAVVSKAEHLVYGRAQDPFGFRAEYLPTLVQVTAVADVTYLLNPEVRTAAGEWEAWSLGRTGALRFETLLDLLRHEVEHDPLLAPDKAEEAAAWRAGLPHPSSFAHGGEMRPGQTLRHRSLSSPSGYYTFAHRDDGALVVQRYSDGSVVWLVSPGEGWSGHLVLEETGNLVLVAADRSVTWQSHTAGMPVDRLVVDDTGTVLLLDAAGVPLWTSKPSPIGRNELSDGFPALAAR